MRSIWRLSCMKAWKGPINKVETCSLACNKKLIVLDVQFVLILQYNLLKPSSFLRHQGLTFEISTWCSHWVNVSGTDLRTNCKFYLIRHQLFFFITKAESVYYAVRSESLYKTGYISYVTVKYQLMLVKISIVKSHEYPSVRSDAAPCGETNGRTWWSW
jgi:hypothetical protein